MSSIDVCLAALLFLHLPFSHPSAILVFPGAASIGDSPLRAEPSEAVPDRSKAHSRSTGRVSSNAKEVLPLRRNITAGTASTTNFSFHIIPYPSSSSCFAWTVPHVYGQNVGLHPFPADAATNWNGDCHFVNRGSKLIAIHVNSTEYTETISPSKNLSSAFPLPRVSYLASHAGDAAAARSLDYSGSLGINTTEFCSPVFSVFQEQQAAVGFSAGSVENNVEFHNLTCFTSTQVRCSRSDREYVQLRSPIRRRIERVPRRERDILLEDVAFYIIQEEDSLQPPDESIRARKLLSRRYGQRATTNPHVAIGGKVTPSWLEQAAVAGSALIGMICAVAGLVLCCIRIKRPLQSTAAIELEDDDGQILREPDNLRGFGPCEFVHSELAAATNNFAEEKKIGRGGFGPVYRGYLNEEDRHVAIKVLSQELSVQGLKEFQAEITIMSQLRHRNIVRLVGWCGRWGGLALVYELMSGGSLDAHLYNTDRHLTWPQRYKIALQLGSALRYLHTDCDQCVVHGDIKPANIMLDASLNAKLGDFGLARLVDHGAEPQTTQVVAGTVGYIDPEFVSSRRPSAESDVYSYGVVLLEIACGRRPTKRSDQVASATLLASARDMYRRNCILEGADRRLDGEFDEMEMERLLVTGLWCAQQDPVRRPSVVQAVDVLRSEDVKLPVLGAMAGSGEIRALEGQAYADLTSESSAYLDDESTETAYLTTEETAYQFPEE